MNMERTDILDIYAPTKKATAELLGGTTRISATALQLLVLFDGKLGVFDVARLARWISAKELAETVSTLLKQGFIGLTQQGKDVNVNFGGFFSVPPATPMSEAVLERIGAQADKAADSLRHKITV